MIHLFIIAWNEQDIIAHTIRHYAPHVNRITLFNNESTDNTVQAAYREFPGIEIINFQTGNRFNDGKHLEIRNTCWQHTYQWGKNDWVIIIDADEWLVTKNKKPLLEALNDSEILRKNHGIIASGIQAVAERINYQDPLIPQMLFFHDTDFCKAIAFRPWFYLKTNFTNGGHHFHPQLSEMAFNEVGVDQLSKMYINTTDFYVLHLKYIHRKNLIKRHMKYVDRLSRYNYAHRCGMEYTNGKEYINECYEKISRLTPFAMTINTEYNSVQKFGFDNHHKTAE